MTERLSDERVAEIAAPDFEEIRADGLPHLNTQRQFHNEKIALAREVLELRRWHPPIGTQPVLVSNELLERFREGPSEPITLAIRGSDHGGWLEFVCTRHDCPAPPALGGEG